MIARRNKLAVRLVVVDADKNAGVRNSREQARGRSSIEEISKLDVAKELVERFYEVCDRLRLDRLSLSTNHALLAGYCTETISTRSTE